MDFGRGKNRSGVLGRVSVGAEVARRETAPDLHLLARRGRERRHGDRAAHSREGARRRSDENDANPRARRGRDRGGGYAGAEQVFDSARGLLRLGLHIGSGGRRASVRARRRSGRRPRDARSRAYGDDKNRALPDKNMAQRREDRFEGAHLRQRNETVAKGRRVETARGAISPRRRLSQGNGRRAGCRRLDESRLPPKHPLADPDGTCRDEALDRSPRRGHARLDGPAGRGGALSAGERSPRSAPKAGRRFR